MFIFTLSLLYPLQIFGPMFCKIWLTSDVLCCTASILNLCAIALDRYYALHDPIMHAQRRTVNFVLGIIALVWFISCVICSPPLLGWNDWPNDEDWDPNTSCKLTEKRGYIVYSSLGSFFIPLAIIIFVYIKIFQVISIISRHATITKVRICLLCGNAQKFVEQNCYFWVLKKVVGNLLIIIAFYSF